MRALVLLAILASPTFAWQRYASSWSDCRKQDFYPSSCIGIYRFQNVIDAITIWEMYHPREPELWKYRESEASRNSSAVVVDHPSPETANAGENYATARAIERAFTPEGRKEEIERKMAEVRAYWAEYERKAKEWAAYSTPVAVALPAAPVVTIERPRIARPAPIVGQGGQVYGQTSTRIGNTIQTETTTGVICTTVLLGGQAFTSCY